MIGEIKSVLVNFGFKPTSPVPQRLLDAALAGGTMLDIGIYNVFMALSVLGKPDIVDADADTRRRSFESGPHHRIGCSHRVPRRRRIVDHIESRGGIQ